MRSTSRGRLVVVAITLATVFPATAHAADVPANADTYVVETTPTTGNGTRSTVRVDASPTTRGYLRFDLTGVTDPITSARLRLRPTSSLTRGIEVRAVADDAWSETGTTFDNAPPVGDLVGTSGPITSGTPVTIDVGSAAVAGEVLSVALTGVSSTAVAFASREAGAATAPVLEVETTPADDTTPPSLPLDARGGSIAPREITVTWSRSTDDQEVGGYEVERDGVVLTTVPGTAFVDRNVSPGSTHVYVIRAVDPAGNRSDPSPPVTATSLAVQTLALSPTADAYVSAVEPTRNFGALKSLRTDGSPLIRSFVRFNLSGIDASVERATLRIWASTALKSGFEIRRVSGPWGELSVTDATAPAVGDRVGSSGPVVAGTWTTVDVTDLVRRRVGEIAVVSPSTTALSLGSRESTTPPELIVETRTDPHVVTVGDISCDPANASYNGGLGTATLCRQLYTSDLALGLGPDLVIGLGDMQYEQGTFSQFMTAYGPCWGRLKPITRPAVGNHEFLTPGAAGYFDYFNGPGAADGPAGPRPTGLYSYDVGEWHVVVLNSYCPNVISCEPDSTQDKWLKADLAAHPAECTVAAMHHPPFSSGAHGNTFAAQPLFKALHEGGVDVLLVSHDHNYERFAPQTVTAQHEPETGLREIVVGTGGRSLRPLRTTLAANSEVAFDNFYGVLEMHLGHDGYDYRFVDQDGVTVRDSGSGDCH